MKDYLTKEQREAMFSSLKIEIFQSLLNKDHYLYFPNSSIKYIVYKP